MRRDYATGTSLAGLGPGRANSRGVTSISRSEIVRAQVWGGGGGWGCGIRVWAIVWAHIPGIT